MSLGLWLVQLGETRSSCLSLHGCFTGRWRQRLPESRGGGHRGLFGRLLGTVSQTG